MLTVLVVGNIDDCRTEVEISNGSGDLVAILYEGLDRWHMERLGGAWEEVPQGVVDEAEARLRLYVNRTGANSPTGLTRAGLSLWLMTKDDGTAMGLPVA
jgi:hypothetical protein